MRQVWYAALMAACSDVTYLLRHSGVHVHSTLMVVIARIVDGHRLVTLTSNVLRTQPLYVLLCSYMRFCC